MNTGRKHRTIYIYNINKLNILDFLEFYLLRIFVYDSCRGCSIEYRLGKKLRTIYLEDFEGGVSKAKTSADCVARSAPWKKERTLS